MKATVSWQQALTFSGQTESGYQQTMDGNGKAISPMESVLLAVGACSPALALVHSLFAP